MAHKGLIPSIFLKTHRCKLGALDLQILPEHSYRGNTMALCSDHGFDPAFGVYDG